MSFDLAIPIQLFILKRYRTCMQRCKEVHYIIVYDSRERQGIPLNVHFDGPQPVVTKFSKSPGRNEGNAWKTRYANIRNCLKVIGLWLGLLLDFFGHLFLFCLLIPWGTECLFVWIASVIWPLMHRTLSTPPDLRCWLKTFSSGLSVVWTKPRLITCVLSFKKRYTVNFERNIYILQNMYI